MVIGNYFLEIFVFFVGGKVSRGALFEFLHFLYGNGLIFACLKGFFGGVSHRINFNFLNRFSFQEILRGKNLQIRQDTSLLSFSFLFEFLGSTEQHSRLLHRF